MSTQVAEINKRNVPLKPENETRQFVSMEVGGQLFGIPVLTVQDVLRPPPITKAPLSPRQILGSINLRGRIVTVISMRRRLGLDDLPAGSKSMHVVVTHKGELCSFVVDRVGDVLALPLSDFEQTPANLGREWQEVALGVYRLENRLLVVLNIEAMLKF